MAELPVQAGEINTDKEIELAEADLIDVQEKPVVSKEAEDEEIWGNKEHEKENEGKMKEILTVYEKARTAGDFTSWMLESGGMHLTKEWVEIDPAVGRYLKENFKEKSGLRLDDLLNALPTAQEYIDKARGREARKTEKRQTVKVIEEKNQKCWKKQEKKIAKTGKTEGEIKEYNKNVVSREGYDFTKAKESRAEDAQRAYVKAYREYDPGFTTNKADDVIYVTSASAGVWQGRQRIKKFVWHDDGSQKKNGRRGRGNSGSSCGK